MINKQNHHYWFLSVLVSVMLISTNASAKNLLYTPDGRVLNLKGGVTQPDLSLYRSPIESKIVDRRFYTNDATFMANESFKFGMEGYNDFVKGAYPIAYKRAFQWVTAREMYFYARYLLDFVGGRGHAGIHMLHGPYWTMQSQRHSAYNKYRRDRSERKFSNKDILLGFYLPLVYQRTGFPRVFEDLQLTYLQYQSVDPHFTGELDNSDSFEDVMSGKKGGWGQPNAYFNDHPQRFDHDKMDTTFDMGGIAQFIKRRAQWADLFFHSNHEEESEISKGVKVSMLGNDAEEGMRGWGLSMGAFNAILAVKSTMFTDGKKLLGINPTTYDPAQGLRYIPHKVEPNIFWVGDLPERNWSLDLEDNSSQLWDQASWIWGTTAYATTAHRRSDAFTDNPPVDGGLIERSSGEVAEAMANTVLKNVQAMHTVEGVFVSQWTPEEGTGESVSMRDMTMMMVALRDMEQSWDAIDKYPKVAESARALLEKNARFLLKVQQADGSFYEAYKVSNGNTIGKNDLSASQWAGIRALLAGYFTTKDPVFLSAARKTFNLLNQSYWVEKQGVYRSRKSDDTVVITPYDIGITLAGMREMIFATPTYLADAQLERVTRWWVQTVNQSGAIQSETNRTGEIYTGFITGDDDGDGIPAASKADGKYGIAPVIAGKVVINLGGSTNESFADYSGDIHNPNQRNTVRSTYQYQANSLQEILLPLTNQKVPELVERNPMTREDGTTIPLQPSKPIKVGLGTTLNLSGQEIYEANCMQCHGQHGEGMDGLPLDKMSDSPHAVMAAIASSGIFNGFMPPWGMGNNDAVGGTLTSAEIDKIVDYVQSEPFKSNFEKSQRGEVLEGALPKDVWFYLSRENVAAKGKKISNGDDVRRFYEKHIDPAKMEAKSSENIKRVKPDSDLSISDGKLSSNIRTELSYH
ncbi:MAG: cytochrome c [Methylococcales bacterium]|nr:cytochrome c [Methylococcales bacterium]